MGGATKVSKGCCIGRSRRQLHEQHTSNEQLHASLSTSRLPALVSNLALELGQQVGVLQQLRGQAGGATSWPCGTPACKPQP